MAGKKQNQAILALEQKLRDNPQSRAFSRLADSYRRVGNLQTAVDLCLEGLIEHPDYVTGRIVLGRCYAQQKKYDAAVGELTRVCAEDRRNHAAMKMLADIFVRQGRAETAGRIYAILRDMEPDNYRVRQLAAKYRSKIKGTILEVLGISADTESVTQNLMASGVNPFDMSVETIGSQTIADNYGWTQTGAAPAASEPSGADIEEQLNSMFVTEEQPADPFGFDSDALTQSDELSGSDVADQLDMIFGQQQTTSAGADLTAGIDTGAATPIDSSSDELTGSDVADQLDMMFGQPGAPPEIDTGVAAPIDSSADGLTGSDVADQLDIMFGQQQAPSMDADLTAGIDTGVITMGADEPTGSDVADQLDIMFGQQQAPSMDAGLMAGLDTGIITMAASDEPTGSDVADQLDIMFGQHNLSAPVTAEAEGGGEPAGSDIEDRLDALFGNIAAPKQADTLIAEAQAGEALGGANAAEEYLRDELLSEPDSREEAAPHADSGEMPADLFDFNDAETMQIDKSEMLAAINAAEACEEDDFAGVADTIAVEHNLTETITFKPNVPEEGTEIVHGEDIEERLSELFSGSDKPAAPLADSGEDTIEDIFDEADGVLSAQELAGIEDLPESDITAELSNNELSSTAADTDIDAILASVDAEVDATMSGIDINAISSESDIVDELSSTELSSTDTDTDIDAILASVDAEVDATMLGIDTNAISSESDIVSELSSTDAETLPSVSQPNKISEDDVQDKIRQLFKADGSESARIDVGADFADGAVDERDAPFDLPDHVLTPTLADIYLQQGQPRLALHIYERLALRDPGDERLAAKIQDIQDVLLQMPEPEPEPEPKPPDEPPVKKRVTEKTPRTTTAKAAERKKKGAEPKEDRRPLAGVRIKKKDSSPSKSKHKPS